MELTLSNGEKVTLREYWDCDNGIESCGFHVVVYGEDKEVLARFNGTFPDTEDEDYDEEEYIKKVEDEISWFI